jgi:signal peptidase I
MKKDYVNVFGYTYFVVATGSMSGTIEVDDIIFVRLTDDVDVNDVITFKSKDGDIITHRLIKKEGSRYITKGDVNNVIDEAITKDQIIGRVDMIVSPSFILKSIAAFLIIFIFLALVNFDGVVKKFILRSDSPKNEKPKV